MVIKVKDLMSKKVTGTIFNASWIDVRKKARKLGRWLFATSKVVRNEQGKYQRVYRTPIAYTMFLGVMIGLIILVLFAP